MGVTGKIIDVDLFILSLHTKQNGIYQPFKWENDDITQDLCARHWIVHRWRNDDDNGIFIVNMYKEGSKNCFENQMPQRRYSCVPVEDYFFRADCSLHLYGFCSHLYTYTFEAPNNMEHFITFSCDAFIGSSFVLLFEFMLTRFNGIPTAFLCVHLVQYFKKFSSHIQYFVHCSLASFRYLMK